MKFGKLILLCLIFATSVHAQSNDISLFDDDQDVLPNLGRRSNPLQELRITPPPLPNVTVDLGEQKQNQPRPQDPKSPPPISAVINIDTPAPNAPQITPPAHVASVLGETQLHDVHGFEIHGFSLNMTPQEVIKLATSSGYKIKTMKENIPLFYTSDYDNRCRKKGVVTPADIKECILDTARAERTLYTAQIVATRKNEEFSFFFTSNNTDNELYKIVYRNLGDNSLNFTRVNTNKKLQRQKEFWNAVFTHFGRPDDPIKMIWGDPQKAYMNVQMYGTAYNAMITLVDMRSYADDYFEAQNEEAERPPKNDFDFE